MMFQILDPDGAFIGPDPNLSDELLTDMYRHMVLARRFDRKAVALQRQGRMGTYAPLEGEEAAQVASALALGPNDWVYPSYREHGTQLVRGVPISTLLAYWRGLPNVEWDPYRYRVQMDAVPIASHLPHAVGHAYQARRDGTDAVTIAYFGDGATSASDFHAALNASGVWKTPNVFFCRNNLYAISVPLDKQTASIALADKAIAYGINGMRVDGMDPLAVYVATDEAVRRARNGEGPTLIEAITYRFGPHGTADDPRRYRSEEEEQEWRAKDSIPRLRTHLTGLGLWDDVREAELIDGIDRRLDAAVAQIEAIPLPSRDEVVRHVYSTVPRILIDELHLAQREAGEQETDFRNETPWPDLAVRPPEGPSESWTMAEAINAALAEALEEDPSVLVLGEDVGKSGGVFRITEHLQERFGPERVLDTPLNESAIVGSSIGMAVAGGRPIAEIQFDGFVYPAFDQIVSHLGRMRYRTRGHVSLPIVVRFPNGAGIGAPEHHGESPEAYFVHTPGLVIVVPSTPFDAKGLLAAAIRLDDPVIFLEPKVLYRAGRQDVPVEPYTLPLGQARVRREGTDVTVVTYGGMVPVSLKAAAAAEQEGISAEVIDLRTLFPWDTETVMASVEKTSRLVVVQEPPRTLGPLAEVAAYVAEHGAYLLEAPIRRVTGFDAPLPMLAIEQLALVDDRRVLSALREIVV
ncbi:MAG: pyruvate dehydrogenase (acetyl-transferring) E1 component subunit alpha [Gammaproteobacteria bacterium]|nr:pyruvate dehydrogenase (acetyl-transferring) E1 component subunit alpha [Gammaproteobacteria bacterium]